jgi:hypothetical protein
MTECGTKKNKISEIDPHFWKAKKGYRIKGRERERKKRLACVNTR